jgi:hypothetical protein
MYQPQQFEVITEMMSAIEDRRITTLEMQDMLNAALSFGMSLVFLTALGSLVRWFVITALEEPEEKKGLPVIGAILPQTEKETPKFGLWDSYLDPKNAYAEAKRLKQLGWQVRVTERMTLQGRKFRVWVRKRLPEHLTQTASFVPAAKRGEMLVRYTGGPQRFAFPEELEGEIRNFAGHEWVILDTPHNQRVIRESGRWVIARYQPAHLKPLELMPATSYNAEQIFARAKQYFGVTTDPDEAGYILPDGTMLDFSGKRSGGTPGKRMLDHRDIAFAWPEDDSPGGFEAMKQVMNWGATRFSTFDDTILVNLVCPATQAQKSRINLALCYYPDAVLVVEVDDTELTQMDYRDFTYPFTNWEAFVAVVAPIVASRRQKW